MVVEALGHDRDHDLAEVRVIELGSGPARGSPRALRARRAAPSRSFADGSDASFCVAPASRAKGWIVLSNPSSRPAGRCATWGVRCPPSAASLSHGLEAVFHWSRVEAGSAGTRRHRPAGLACRAGDIQSSSLPSGARSLATSKTPWPTSPEHATDAEQLVVLARVGARHDFAVLRAVQHGTRGREAERARFAAPPSRSRPSPRSRPAGLLVLRAALAHHVGAHRAVGNLGSPRRRSAASPPARPGIRGKVSHSQSRCPRRGRCPGCPRRPSISWIRNSLTVRARTGCEAHAAVAHHHRGDAVPARRREVGVPGDLAVVVGVHVDPAGQHELAAGVNLLASFAHVGSDRDDAVAVDGHPSARERAAITEIMPHAAAAG